MAATDIFSSLDAQIIAVRQEWEGEKKMLEQKIFSLETELTLTKEGLARAVEARDDSFKKLAALLVRFSIVSEVFREAHELALAAGLHTKEIVANRESVSSDEPAEGESK